MIYSHTLQLCAHHYHQITLAILGHHLLSISFSISLCWKRVVHMCGKGDTSPPARSLPSRNSIKPFIWRVLVTLTCTLPLTRPHCNFFQTNGKLRLSPLNTLNNHTFISWNLHDNNKLCCAPVSRSIFTSWAWDPDKCLLIDWLDAL